MSAGPETARRGRRRRRRVSVVGVLGEILITAGALVLLFLGWQLWFSELTVGHELKSEATEQSREWNESTTPPAVQTPDPSETDEPDAPDAPPVEIAPANAARFGMLLVPRWGTDYYRPIAEGVGVSDVLNQGELGHYPTTSMPGAVGNFAIAAHRMGHGGSLHHIHELRLGDHIYVETASGWYEYAFRNLEYVHPSGVGVLDPVPQDAAAAPDERFITLTSCNPMYTSNERIIAYGVFERFYPRDRSAPAFGAPDEIAPTVTGKKAS